MKLLSYELMDVMKEMEGSSMPEERVLCHYESCASQLVMELVYKVHMVGRSDSLILIPPATPDKDAYPRIWRSAEGLCCL